MHAYVKVKNSGKTERSRKANTMRNKLREKASIIKLAKLSKPLYEVKKRYIYYICSKQFRQFENITNHAKMIIKLTTLLTLNESINARFRSLLCNSSLLN